MIEFRKNGSNTHTRKMHGNNLKLNKNLEKKIMKNHTKKSEKRMRNFAFKQIFDGTK